MDEEEVEAWLTIQLQEEEDKEDIRRTERLNRRTTDEPNMKWKWSMSTLAVPEFRRIPLSTVDS
jgi:hypothetical protein